MRMLPRHPLKLAALVVAVGSLGQPGCRSKEPSQSVLVETLNESPIFQTDGLAVVALGPRAAASRADEAVTSGIDLWGLYKANTSARDVRMGLAYLLLMSANESYADYADTHLSQLEAGREFRLWTFVLEHKHTRIPNTYRKRLEHILASAQEPSSRLFTARQDLANGLYADAAAHILAIMAREDGWESGAMVLLQAIPINYQPTVLLPYLRVQTPRGAYAAMMLARIPSSRDKAIAYLESAKVNSDRAVARAAERASAELSQISGASTRPER